MAGSSYLPETLAPGGQMPCPLLASEIPALVILLLPHTAPIPVSRPPALPPSWLPPLSAYESLELLVSGMSPQTLPELSEKGLLAKQGQSGQWLAL